MSSKGSGAMTSLGISLLRVITGIVFVAHGWRKVMAGMDQVSGALEGYGVPAPLPSAFLVTAVELVCGAALTLGLRTRWAVIPPAIAMTVALLIVHLPHGFFLPEGFEYTLMLLTALVTILLTGPGAVSIDRFLKGGKKDDSSQTSGRTGPEPA